MKLYWFLIEFSCSSFSSSLFHFSPELLHDITTTNKSFVGNICLSTVIPLKFCSYDVTRDGQIYYFFFIRWCRKSNKLIAFSYILEFPFLVSVFHPCWGAHTSVLLVSQALMNGELCLRKCIWYKLSMQIIQNEISIHTGLVKAQFNNECFHCWSKLCCCWQKTKDGRHAKGQWERRKAVEVRGRI